MPKSSPSSKKPNLSHLQASIPGFERVLAAIKPDGVKRALVGEVIRRLEMLGLKMVAGKMLVPTEAQAKGNYPDITTPVGHEWMVDLGRKTLKTYQENDRDVMADHGVNNPEIIGQRVYDSLIEYLTSGPMVIMVWEGHQAVGQARVLAGNTTPLRAVPGPPQEALDEIAMWFGEDAKFSDKYIRTDHLAMFGQI